MSWRALTEPIEFDACGDEALYERGRAYGFGPADEENRCPAECEVVYYAIRYEDGRFGTMCMTHMYRRHDDDPDDLFDEEYEYFVAGYLFKDTIEEAIMEVDRLAAVDESEMFFSPKGS